MPFDCSSPALQVGALLRASYAPPTTQLFFSRAATHLFIVFRCRGAGKATQRLIRGASIGSHYCMTLNLSLFDDAFGLQSNGILGPERHPMLLNTYCRTHCESALLLTNGRAGGRVKRSQWIGNQLLESKVQRQRPDNDDSSQTSQRLRTEHP